MPLASPLSSRALVERIAGPLCIFGAVLFIGVLAISFLFSPGRFPVKTGDKVIRLRELIVEEQTLKGRELELLKEKQTIASLTPMPTLALLRPLRASLPSVFEGLSVIEEARVLFALRTLDPITIDQVRLLDGNMIQFSGYVLDESGRALQILASFVDRLREDDVFSSVTEPEYQEVVNADGIRVSPFTISVHLADDK